MTTSSEDQSSLEDQYLVDFLYVDRPRVASLSAQLFASGHLTATKTTSSKSEESGGKFGAGIPGVVKGDATLSDKTQETVERQFDATWAGPLNVLRELNARGYLIDGVDSAAFGQLIIARGKIHVLDLRMVQKLWKPILSQEGAKAIAAAPKAEKAAATRAAAESKAMVEIVEQLPHMLQFRVRNEDYACWATLDPDQMTINPNDLAFKHGAYIPGEWLVLAVLDAKPSDPFLDTLDAMGVGGAEGTLIGGMQQMLKGLREMFGRGADEYGITPLAIYRVVDKS